MRSVFEKMGGTYAEAADGMYYPNLALSGEASRYGKYGMLRKTFLKEHRKGLYESLLLTGRLTAHLNKIDDSASQRMEMLTEQMKKSRHIDAKMKAADQLAWVQAMNQIYLSAEEIVLNELVYAQ